MGNNNGGEIGAFFAGFLVGGLVGAATALILAPQSGEETREQIRQRAVEIQGRAEDTPGRPAPGIFSSTLFQAPVAISIALNPCCHRPVMLKSLPIQTLV